MDQVVQQLGGRKTFLQYWGKVKGFSTADYGEVNNILSRGLSTVQIFILARKMEEAGLMKAAVAAKILYLHTHAKKLSYFHPFWAESYEHTGRRQLSSQKWAAAAKSLEQAAELYARLGMSQKVCEAKDLLK